MYEYILFIPIFQSSLVLLDTLLYIRSQYEAVNYNIFP